MTNIPNNNEGEKLYKVSDIVAHVLALNGVRTVFGVSGGASLHLLHAIHNHPDLRLITTHHEQAAAMAADSTARITGEIGAAISTSGPGATNLITGIAGCYYDSVPAIFITGQVSTNRLGKTFGVRQLGFQETPIVEMVTGITKYAIQVLDPYLLIGELENCIRSAISGRPGPALIDIPDDIQRMNLSLPKGLPMERVSAAIDQSYLTPDVSELRKLSELVSNSLRPVVVLGWGVHLAKQEEAIRKVLDKLQWPTVLTWGGADILSEECAYRIGTFGTHGNRDANFIIQNSDLIISIGSRLDTKSTGSPVAKFATAAKRVMIDLDISEIRKFREREWNLDLGLNVDLRSEGFQKILEVILNSAKPIENHWNRYIELCRKLLNRPHQPPRLGYVDPYEFIDQLSAIALPGTRLLVDTGCSIAWVSQAWKFKLGQRLFHDFNNTAMGWALPAAIGSLAINDSTSTIAIIGDGSLMMSLQELATVRLLDRPLKLFIINNSGYSMIKQTQDQWFNSEYFASDAGDSLSFPHYSDLAQAFGLDYIKLNDDTEIESTIKHILASDNSILCEVLVSPLARVIPQVKFGNSIEFMEPELSEEVHELLSQAISS
jgi:acetolactate synthase-1/2/3 large subunit